MGQVPPLAEQAYDRDRYVSGRRTVKLPVITAAGPSPGSGMTSNAKSTFDT
jgi:hypothetical protein